MQRRDFMKFCAASAAAAGAPEVSADAQPHLYQRVQLVAEDGTPLHARAVPANRNLIFHYPYAATPCFLLNLGRPAKAAAQLKTVDDKPYEWHGGVGAERSIVAYSAICAHKLAYPTRDISFISFRTETSARNKFGNVIHCCAEHSQYDPAAGARVVAGPAPQPLAAILLEHNARNDALYAVGTLGGELFNDFFAKYQVRLSFEHGDAVRRAAGATATVYALENYCRQQVKC